MTGREHAKLLGIFFLIQSGLSIFGGIIAILIYGGMGSLMMANARREEEQFMAGFFLVMAVVVGFFILIFGALYFFAGWRLFKQKPNARTLGIIASCVALLGFPIGTALGIYGLWFFFGDAGKNYFNGGGNTGANNYPPPPPQSWQ